MNPPEISQHSISPSKRAHRDYSDDNPDDINNDEDGYLQYWGVGEADDPQMECVIRLD